MLNIQIPFPTVTWLHLLVDTNSEPRPQLDTQNSFSLVTWSLLATHYPRVPSYLDLQIPRGQK